MSSIALYWTPFGLTPSGRPVLLQSEIEVVIAQNTSIYYGTTKVHMKGTLTLTTHRLLWNNSAKNPVAISLALDHISHMENKAGFIGFSSPKITVQLKPLPSSPSTTTALCMLSFHGSERDNFALKLDQTLKQKSWVVIQETKQAAKLKEDFSTSSAGIKGIIRKVELSHKQEEGQALDAFGDLDQLIRNAESIVKLADSYTTSKEGKNNDSKKDQDDFNTMLQDMGISSPVTRATAGTAYHVQLARQLSDFITKPMEKSGGMMSITDIYCIFNRARGTELISPDDLLDACNLFQNLHLPYRLRKFPSGLLVLQTETHSDEKTLSVIVKTIHTNGPLTALELCKAMGNKWSLLLAKQHLETGEQMQLLCRDVSIEGIRFYINLFPQYAASIKSH